MLEPQGLPGDYALPDAHSGSMPPLRNNRFGSNFLDELKQSWVYSRYGAFRLSSFSSGHHSTTWSCLSTLTLSEVSNISVYSLIVTADEVRNPQRLSQTWSNEQSPALWAPMPTVFAPKLVLVPQECGVREKPLPAPPICDDGTQTIHTVKGPDGHSNQASSIDISDPLSESPTLDSARSLSVGVLKPPDEQDNTRHSLEELARGNPNLGLGSRWHFDCFQCNFCGSLSDSDANLLQLRDGHELPVCSGCTYPYLDPKVKFGDLAFLTSDRTFCVIRFKCRNCGRGIEDLKYARTSRGMFCVDCFESRMERRTKKILLQTKSETSSSMIK